MSEHFLFFMMLVGILTGLISFSNKSWDWLNVSIFLVVASALGIGLLFLQ